MNDKHELRFFRDRDHVEAYVRTEIISSLLDELYEMEGPKRKHFTDKDRQTMKDKIHDVKLFFGA